ncbi:hypothetical protein EJB05_38834, partial [Eragrostis curvula]
MKLGRLVYATINANQQHVFRTRKAINGRRCVELGVDAGWTKLWTTCEEGSGVQTPVSQP